MKTQTEQKDLADIPAPSPPASADVGAVPSTLVVAAMAEGKTDASTEEPATDPFECVRPRYYAYREALMKFENETGKEADKWILTISGAALGFSMTFVKDFVGAAAPLKSATWLYGAWVEFALPVVLILVNLQVAYSAALRYRKIADEEVKKFRDDPNYQGDMWENINKRQNEVWRNRFVETFNWISWLSFIAGIVSLAIFIGSNVK